MTKNAEYNFYADPEDLTAPTVCDKRSSQVRESSEGGSVISTIFDYLPLAIVAIGIIIGIFGYIKFIVSGGYGEAIARFKEYGLFSFDSAVFVNSTAGYFYHPYVVIPVAVICVILLARTYVIMFRTSEEKGKKIAAVAAGILSIIGFIAFTVISNYNMPINAQPIAMATGALMIISLVLVSKINSSREYAKKVRRAILLYFIGLPAVVWLLENLIGFGSVVIGLILAGGIVALMISFLSSAGGSESSSGGSSSNSSYNRDIDKIDDRMNYLSNQQADYAYYNQRQAEGAFGYQHYDANKNREKIRDMENEKRALAEQRAKLVRKMGR